MELLPAIFHAELPLCQRAGAGLQQHRAESFLILHLPGAQIPSRRIIPLQAVHALVFKQILRKACQPCKHLIRPVGRSAQAKGQHNARLRRLLRFTHNELLQLGGKLPMHIPQLVAIPEFPYRASLFAALASR